MGMIMKKPVRKTSVRYGFGRPELQLNYFTRYCTGTLEDAKISFNQHQPCYDFWSKTAPRKTSKTVRPAQSSLLQVHKRRNSSLQRC